MSENRRDRLSEKEAAYALWLENQQARMHPVVLPSGDVQVGVCIFTKNQWFR